MPDSNGRLNTVSPEALAAAELTEGAKRVLHESPTPPGHITKLSELSLFPDAIKYLAHSLEPRSSLRWSLSCARELQPDPTPAEQDAFLAVDKFLAEPNDANRRASKLASEQAQLSKPAGCIALAAFFSEGSIAPPGLAPVPPPPHVSQNIAAAAVILAVTAEPEKAPERYARCIQLGLQLGVAAAT